MKLKTTTSDKLPKKTPKRGAAQAAPELVNGFLAPAADDVMTLSEAAAFLRAPVDEIRKMADAAKLPARRVAGEWRFLSSALRAWLSQTEPPAELSSKERMLAVAGAWKDDETAEAMVEEIYRERKRHPVGG